MAEEGWKGNGALRKARNEIVGLKKYEEAKEDGFRLAVGVNGQ